jgi:hypothetical protein
MMTSMKRMYAGGTPSSRFFESGCSSFNYDLVPNVTYSTRWGCGLLSCKIVSNGTCFNDIRSVPKPHTPTFGPTCSLHSETLLASGMHLVPCTFCSIGHLTGPVSTVIQHLEGAASVHCCPEPSVLRSKGPWPPAVMSKRACRVWPQTIVANLFLAFRSVKEIPQREISGSCADLRVPTQLRSPHNTLEHTAHNTVP